MLAKVEILRRFALVGASSSEEKQQVEELADSMEADLHQTASMLAQMQDVLKRLKTAAQAQQEG